VRYFEQEFKEHYEPYDELKVLRNFCNVLVKFNLLDGVIFDYTYDDQAIESGCRCGGCYTTYRAWEFYAWNYKYDMDYEIEYSSD